MEKAAFLSSPYLLKNEKGVNAISSLKKSMDKQGQTSLDQQINKLKKILHDNPNDITVLMVYAESNLRKGNRLEALKAYQKVLKIKRDVPDVRVALAKIFISLKHYADAYREILEVFDMDPNHIEGHLLLKRMKTESEVPEDLQDKLNRHNEEFHPPAQKVGMLIMQFDLEKQKYSRLIEDYDRQLEDDEGNPIVLYNKSKANERLQETHVILEELASLLNKAEVQEAAEAPDMVEPIEAAEPVEPMEEAEELLIEEEVPLHLEMPAAEDIMPLAVESGDEEELVEVIEDNQNEVLVDSFPEVEETAFSHSDQKVLLEDESLAESQIQDPVLSAISDEAESAESMEDISTEDVLKEEAPALQDDSAEDLSHKPEPAKTPSKERLEFYQQLSDEVIKVLTTINQTRGITSSLVMDNTGHILQIESSETFNIENLSAQILEGVTPLLKWKSDDSDKVNPLLYWVIEFKKGLMVLQPLTNEVFLVTIGKSGANFGAVRYSIEKNTGKLLASLASIPD